MKLIKKIGVLSTAKFLSNLAALIIFILLSRHVDPSTYGFYRKVLVYLLFFAKVLSLGLPNSLLKYGKDEVDYNLRLILRSMYLLVPLIIIVLVLGSLLNFFVIHLPYHSLIILFVILILLDFSESGFIILNHTYWSGIFSFLIKGGVFLFSGIVLLFSRDLGTTFYYTLFYAFIVLGLFLSLIRFRIRIDRFNLGISIKEQLSFAFTVWFAALAGLLMQQSDKLVVSVLENNQSFAIFANGAFEIPLISIINGAIFTTTTPLMSQYFRQQKKDQVINLWRDVSAKSMLILLPAFAFLALRSEEIMVMLFGDFYQASALIFFLYLFFLPLRVYIFSGIFMAIDQQKYYLKQGIIVAVLNVIFTFLLVKYFGMLMAPLTSLVLSLYFEIKLFNRLKSFFQVRLAKIFLFKRIISIMTISFLVSWGIKSLIQFQNIYVNFSVHFLIFTSVILTLFVISNEVSLKTIWK